MIEALGLTRSYTGKQGDVDAVAGVDLQVDQSEVVGFLGPNGAGKTTTVRMLTTLLTPTSGTAVVAGHDVVRERAAVRRLIGYVAQSGAPSDHHVADELMVQARLHGMSKGVARSRIAELAETYELQDFLPRPLARLSGGQRRRFEIAAGVLHRPSVLFLDEPTASLDPHSRAQVWRDVRALRDEVGTTVFLTTHNLDEADVLCDRVFVIDGGRIVAQGRPDELKAELGGDGVTLHTTDVDVAQTVVTSVVGPVGFTTSATSVQFHVAQAARRLPELLKALDNAGVVVDEVSTSRPSLDDVFLKVTGRAWREPARPAAPAAPPVPPSTPTPPAATGGPRELEEVLAS